MVESILCQRQIKNNLPKNVAKPLALSQYPSGTKKGYVVTKTKLSPRRLKNEF